MYAKLGRILASLLLLTALTFLFSSSLAAQPVDRDVTSPKEARLSDHSTVSSRSDEALQKLSPDLRAAAASADEEVRLVYVLIRPGASVARYMEPGDREHLLGMDRDAVRRADRTGVVVAGAARGASR